MTAPLVIALSVTAVLTIPMLIDLLRELGGRNE
jgi:hypothetical protein